MSSHLKAELAATCSTLGRLHKGEYLIEPECLESVKDLIRYLKRDNEAHEIRRYLGESKVLQNDLIHIIKSCPDDNSDLFDVTLRLLINLTTPTMLFYGEEIPAEKIGRNIYLSLIGHSQEYKVAFCDVHFWNKICGKLTDLFETDWAERSADDGIQIERILMLLRNVLQVPADVENEKRPDNDITVHDKVLWALRQSQILELLLFVSSNKNEEQYYLNLLEIFSLILREQNPKLLALCDVQLSGSERSKETEELLKVREFEKKSRNKYVNMRNFKPTFVMKGVKSLSNMDVVCHKSLDKVNELDLNNLGKKQVRTRRNRVPVESERTERRSTFSVRLFLKEFCLEFLSCSFNHFMNVVKSKLDSGKSLANDQTYYFWALKYFLDFAMASNSDVDLVKNFLSSESFHFVQTSMDNAFEHLLTDKKKTVDWVKRIHLILKAYRSLLETLFWMDCSKNPLTRSISREIKSQIFYVVEYREMTLHVLLQYDSTKFSVSYLRDLIETTHLFVKLLEEYSKQTKLVVQKVTRKKASKKNKKVEEELEITPEEAWEKIKNDVYDMLCSDSTFPEIPPFDAALDIPIDDQKGRAMKKIQNFLRAGNIRDSIGLLRSAKQVWPENDCFGSEGMSIEDETMALQEICLADLSTIEIDVPKPPDEEFNEDKESSESELEEKMQIVEQDFDIMDYKKRLVHKKVVEGCGMLLKNYKNNSDHTNHCVIKLLHRIGWECCMPAMLFQASIFWTLYKIMHDKSRSYDEINTFTINLMRKFQKHASKNPVVFLELLFWKDHNVALEIQHGYAPYEKTPKQNKRSKKKKADGLDGDEVEGTRKRRGRKKKNSNLSENELDEINGENENGTVSKKKIRRKKRGRNKSSECIDEDNENRTLKSIGNLSNLNEFRSDDSNDSDNDVRGSMNESNEDDSDNNYETERKDNSFFGSLEKERGNDDIQNERDVSRSSLNDKNYIEENAGEKALVDVDNKKEEALTCENELLPNVTTEKLTEYDEKRDRQNDFSEKETGTRDSKINDSSDDEDISGRSKRGRPVIESSDDENEGESQANSVLKDGRNLNSVLESVKDDSNHGKESDYSSSSQASSSSRKKRAREHRKADEINFSEDSLDSETSKSKKLRYVGSDSSDSLKSDDEIPSIGKKQGRRRRLAVIDSDSDLDTNSLDDK